MYMPQSLYIEQGFISQTHSINGSLSIYLLSLTLISSFSTFSFPHSFILLLTETKLELVVQLIKGLIN